MRKRIRDRMEELRVWVDVLLVLGILALVMMLYWASRLGLP